MTVVDPMGPVMSLPTDPFAAPSSGPLPLELARADDAARTRTVHLRRRVLAAATGTVALGAAAVGVTLGVGSGPDLSSAASTLAPAAGAAATLAPPVVGEPIVPRDPTPPPVTTRATPTAETTRTTRSRPTTRATADREQEAIAAMRARAVQVREQAWEQAFERAMAARGAAGARGHAHGHHR